MANTPIKLNDNTTIPLLAFGTGTALYGTDAEHLVTAAINAGFTHLDGAQAYKNEDSLGAGIVAAGKARKQLFVTTKLAKQPEDKSVRDSLVESLAKLQVDYVDLFLIHTPIYYQEPGRLKAVWRQVEAIKKEGLARSIGVSNFRPAQLREILDGAEFPPSVNQIEFHPYVYNDLLPTLELQKQYGIVTESYGGLSPIFRFKGGPLDPVLTSIANRLSETTGKPFNEAEVLFLWQREKGVVIVTTTTKESRLAGYLSILDAPKLTDDEINLIDEAGAKEHHRHFVRVTILED
ncbi:Aldo/keto reductase [Multifurca ochricompacta]|uniref:Aldo/keto reductase n=1 Tax=Multifurca ochricompacta TaxID=376703 RepID=A0AAD4QQ54_9AGAM|nr:Aldo/keto reductase [Multifurca ochricompacta]